jgi:hypothetical protein
MTSDVIEKRGNSGRWIAIGAILAVLGLACIIFSLILGNSWNEEGGTEHGVSQAALLIPGAIAVGLGIVALVIGFIKRGPKQGESAGVTRRS